METRLDCRRPMSAASTMRTRCRGKSGYGIRTSEKYSSDRTDRNAPAERRQVFRQAILRLTASPRARSQALRSQYSAGRMIGRAIRVPHASLGRMTMSRTMGGKPPSAAPAEREEVIQPERACVGRDGWSQRVR